MESSYRINLMHNYHYYSCNPYILLMSILPFSTQDDLLLFEEMMFTHPYDKVEEKKMVGWKQRYRKNGERWETDK